MWRVLSTRLRPARKALQEIGERLPLLRLDLLGQHQLARRRHQRNVARARVAVDQLDGRGAEAALRRVDDALEGEVVGRVHGRAEIGERVADLHPLVEARAADDAIVQAERDEAVLELAHLVGGAHQDRHLVQRMPLPLQLLDVLADGARLLRGIPAGDDRDLLAHLRRVGEERLAEPAFVVGDQARGGGEDVAGRAVVPLQPDHGRAGKIALEAQDVVDLRAAPAVDRLVVVADAADVLVPLREQPQPEILRDVGVLVFVDQHVAEAALEIGEHVGLLAEEPQAFEQQVAEVGGVQRLQPLPGIRRRARAPLPLA